jgi:hypothetical protein
MKLERVALLTAVFALIITGWCLVEIHSLQARLDRSAGEPRLARRPGGNPTPGATNLEARLKKLETASPGVGEVMAGVQLHFAKLYFAGEARNWDLAAFERGEIAENLDAVAALRPEEKGVNLAGIIEAFKNTQLVALQDAVEMKDRGLFRDAYRDSIVMCNTCHQSTGRPFIVVTTPTNPPVFNQQWAYPAPAGK